MKRRHAFALAVLLAPFACKKNGPSESADDAGKKTEAKAEREVDDSEAASASTSEANGKSGEVTRECPESLSGKEKENRVIGKSCGTVLVSGNYSIDGVTLTLEAGATLAFKDGAQLGVGYYEPGKLVVQGTPEEPVTLTASGDKAPGVWKGVRLYGKANRSSLSGLIIEYAGETKSGALKVDATDVVLADSTIRHVKEAGLVVDTKGTFTEIRGNTFEDVDEVAMRVTPIVAGQIGSDNRFVDDARVHVLAGKLTEDATWKVIGTPFLVLGRVGIDGSEGTRATLSIQPGAQVQFDTDGALRVGYYAEGGIEAVGSEDEPISLSSNDKKEPGAWEGIAVYGKGEGKFEYVKLEYGGQSDKEGVLHVRDKGSVEVQHVSFSSNKVGVVVDGRESELEVFDDNTFESTPIALRLPVRNLGSLGGANEYGDDARIVVTGGTVDEDATWKPQQGALIELDKNVHISATVEVEPGFELRIEDGVKIDVGYYDTASLRLEGTEDEPIRIIGKRDEPGTWKSLVFHGKAHGNVIEHVVVRNAGGDAGVEFKRDADGKVSGLTCGKCETAALTWHKDAKVETSDVKATEGTPKAEIKP